MEKSNFQNKVIAAVVGLAIIGLVCTLAEYNVGFAVKIQDIVRNAVGLVVGLYIAKRLLKI